MKTIEIKSINISNFKGIESRKIDFNTCTHFRGRNGTGKSTIADAIWWVLFGKDSSGAADFPVKRKDDTGTDIRELIVEVEMILEVDGWTHVLRRVQEENWVTKRGDLTRAFQGNVQTLYYNESKMKTAEYAKAVNDIVEETKFKILTNPTYFMTQIDDKKRREILMRLIGNEKDIEDALRSSPAYILLNTEWEREINRNKDFTGITEFAKQKARNNADEIDRLPYQIVELEKTIDEDLNEARAKVRIAANTKELNALKLPVADEKPQNVTSAEQNVRNLQMILDSMNDKTLQECLAQRRKLSMARQDIEAAHGGTLAKVTMIQNDIDMKEYVKKARSTEKVALLKEYNETKNTQWIAPVIKTTCPTCGQALPDINEAELLENHRNKFNEYREERLAQILEKGTALAELIALLGAEIQAAELKKIELNESILVYGNTLENTPTADSVKEADFIDNEKATAIKAEIQSDMNLIESYRSNKADDSAMIEYRARQDELHAFINEDNIRLGRIQTQKETKKRIEELKAREGTLLKEKDYFKTLAYQCELFMKDKNETLEKDLSAKFGSIQWRLFKQQVNGGFQQVCDAYLNGKPYDAQSTGERLFTGIDIINTFQDIYESECPILIDNRESLTLSFNVNSQIISMYADDKYTELTQF